MIRRLLAPLILAGCAEHTSEYQDLLDKFGSETTVESSTTTTPTAGASTMTAGDSAGTTEASTENSGATGPNPGDDTGQSSSETPGASTGQSSSETTGASAGLPSDPRPTVTDLVCDPEKAEEIGPVSCTYLASTDAVEAELLDDGKVVATGPAGPPLIFPVTSAPHNNPGTTITVVVRDEAGQTAETSIFQPSTVKDPGTAVWTKLEPNDGAFSMGNAVALQGDHVIAAGVHFKNPLVVGTLRRYDLGGEWEASEGWSKPHTEWTNYAWLKTGSFGPSGLAVDAEGNLILVGLGFDNGQPRSYVARFFPDGTLDWEKPGDAGTEARAVGVQPDGTIWVAGAMRTGVNPEFWDMEISVFGADKTSYGPFHYSDPEDNENQRSERGRAVAVLKNGDVVIGGTREIRDLNNDPNKVITRGVTLLFEGKGKFVAEWTSSGDKLAYDAILAAEATDEGFVTCGYAHTDPNEPGSKQQILIRWHGEDLQEIKAARLETTTGAAVCNALGYNMEGATIVGAQVYVKGQNNNQWIFAVEDAASLRVDYRRHNGSDNGDDRVQGLDCKYKCAWVGAETVDGAVQWIAGLFRG